MEERQQKLRIFISETYDPYFNLATEDWIFREMDTDAQVLFLWRNEDTVVIGRFQNPWAECHTEKMSQDGIHLARRQSGGGTVFQDLGNTNFTFMSSRDQYDQNRNNQIIINTLKKWGICAQASGRNDLVVATANGERKFSGSAFKKSRDRCFHHGTLLLNANLEKLSNYLNPQPKKLQAKGIASVRSRVINLSTLNKSLKHNQVCQKLIEEFQQTYSSSCEIEVLNHQTLQQIPSLKKYYEQLKDWNWRFGKTPNFSHQMQASFDWGHLDLHLDVHRGTIEKAQIFSDALCTDFLMTAQDCLVSHPYEEQQLRKTFSQVPGAYTEDFINWLCQEIR